MSTQLVSVVMCTYNGVRFVGEQLQSILQQSYPNIEVIVGDDASSDGTWKIVEEFTNKDQRIRAYRNEKNIGYNLNFNKACGLAIGAYIAISDQDDVWEPSKIESLLSRLEESPSHMLVHGISARFEEMGKPHLRSLKKVNYIEGNDMRKFFLLNIISGHSMLLRVELLRRAQPFPQKIYYDWWLAAHACAAGDIVAVQKILTWHRMHDSNATGAAKPVIFFYKQIQLILPALLQIPGIKGTHREFGERLLRYYSVFPAKKFSFPLCWFLLKHARVVFAHKKRFFPWISYVKHAIRFAQRDTKA
jgi:glycosyltransferase involved in cell wall biosynthesis